MTDREIKRMLKGEAASAAVPDVLASVKARASVLPVSVPDFSSKLGLRRKRVIYAAAAALCVILFALLAVPKFTFDSRVYAFVSLESGFEISVNQEEKVVDIKAESQGAQAVLSAISYKKQPLESVLQEILAGCIASDLITCEDVQNYGIAFSVHCTDEKGTEHLKQCVRQAIEAYCGGDGHHI